MVDNTKLIEELFEAKAHLGHKTNRVHPKAKRYIYTVENGVSIIDLTHTAVLLDKALSFVQELTKVKKTMLVVATKKNVSSAIQSLCQGNLVPYVVTKWPAGLISNFETITKNIKKLISLKKDKIEGTWNTLAGHDRSRLEKELAKLERYYGGLIQLNKLPDVLFVIDVKKEKNAVKEAKENNIRIIAITDTNVDPLGVDYPIPANDDSLSSVEYITKKVIKAYTNIKSKS